MLQATGSALVSGERVTDTVVWITVLRGFCFDGAAYAPGETLAVPSRFAKEMCSLKKAQMVSAPVQEPVRGPLLRLDGGLTVTPTETPTRKRGTYGK